MEKIFYVWDNCSMAVGIFRRKIKQFRDAAGLTQEELAAALKMSTRSVTNWETGVIDPSRHALDKLANFFQVSRDDFYDEEALTAAVQKGIARVLAEEVDQVDRERLYRIIEHLPVDRRRFDLWLQHGEMYLDEIGGPP